MQTNLFKEAVVWSKTDCAACEAVKNLLASKGYEMDIRSIDIPKLLMEFKNQVPHARSVPQVFIGGRYIGGLEQVRQYLTR